MISVVVVLVVIGYLLIASIAFGVLERFEVFDDPGGMLIAGLWPVTGAASIVIGTVALVLHVLAAFGRWVANDVPDAIADRIAARGSAYQRRVLDDQDPIPRARVRDRK